MSHNIGHTVHVAKHAAESIEKLPKLPEKKNPIIAAILGICFGAIGIGLYFQSWKDFWVCIGLLIFLLICIPGVGAIPGWISAAVYGFYRATTSNEKHR